MSGLDFPDYWQSIRIQMAGRVREIREDLYGAHGGPILASALNLPYRSWSEYEQGELMPADVMLRFLEHTRAEPHWLLTGQGPRYTRA